MEAVIWDYLVSDKNPLQEHTEISQVMGTQYDSNSSTGDCGLTPAECVYVICTKQVLFSLTITFDTITLLTILILQKYKTFSQRIFLNILICNFGEAISSLSNDGHPGQSCRIFGYFIQSFGFALFMWVCGLTVFLASLLHIKKEKRLRERTYILICWIFPFVLGLLPLATKNYGPAGVFCWITLKDHHDSWGQGWRLAAWWVPVMLGILLIFIAFVFMHYRASKNTTPINSSAYRPSYQNSVKHFLRPLTGYAAAFVILHTVMFIDRLYTLINPTPHIVSRILHTVSFASYGLALCSLFYIINGKNEFTRDRFLKGLSRCKRSLMCKSSGRIVTFNVETAISTVAEAAGSSGPPIRSLSHTYREKTLGDGKRQGGRRVEFNSVIQENSFSINFRSLSESVFDPTRFSNNDPGSPTEPMRIRTDNSRTVSKKEVVPLCTQHSCESTVGPTSNKLHVTLAEHTKAKDIDSRYLRQMSESDYELTELSTDLVSMDTETPADEPKYQKYHGVTFSHQDSTTEKDKLVSYKYSLRPGSDLLKICMDKDCIIWQNWLETETVQTWIARITEDLPADSVVTVQDKDGAAFSKGLTWKEIKDECPCIHIIINSHVTEIEVFCERYQSRNGNYQP